MLQRVARVLVCFLLCASSVLAAGRDPPEIESALQALGKFEHADDIKPLRQITQFIGTATDEQQRVALGKLSSRLKSDAFRRAVVPLLLTLAAEEETELVRLGAIAALGASVDEEHYPRLARLLFSATADPEREALRDAIGAAARRLPDKEKAAAPIVDAIGRSQGSTRVAAISALSRIGGKAALDSVRHQLKNTDMTVSEAAMHALTEWADASAAGDMLNIAMSPSASHRMLALRGLNRVLAMPSTRSPAETLNIYRQMMDLALKPEEKKVVLAGLAELKDAGALTMTTSLLADDAIKTEAAAATLKLAIAVAPTEKDSIRAALEQVLRSDVSADLKKRAAALLETSGASAKG